MKLCEVCKKLFIVEHGAQKMCRPCAKDKRLKGGDDYLFRFAEVANQSMRTSVLDGLFDNDKHFGKDAFQTLTEYELIYHKDKQE